MNGVSLFRAEQGTEDGTMYKNEGKGNPCSGVNMASLYGRSCYS